MKAEAEIIFVTYPAPGHLLVSIEFAKSLIKRDDRIHTITILHWALPLAPQAHLFAKSLVASEPRIRLVALPDVEKPPPLELFFKAPEAYILESTKKTVPLVRDALSTLFSSRNEPGSVRVVGLVIDFFCVPMIEVANEFNLPSYIFLTCNAGLLSMMKYLPERHRITASELDLSSGEVEHPIPGYVCSVPTKVLPPGLFVRESYEAWVEIAEKFPGAKGILVNSFTCLEQNAFDYFARLPENYPPVYPVGPVLSLKDRPSPDLDPSDRDRIMRWLEDQPESSIVYICFGSLGIIGKPQIEEIAQALELTGYRFLWSIRTNPTEKASPYDLLPEGFLDRTACKGLVCDWAPQVEVLAHKAIGGFVSHCGWNSVLESLWFGVPIATWPMYAEQQLNAFTMVKELGLAVELRLDYVSAYGEIVKAEEIAGAIRSLMDGEDTPRERVKEMAAAARKALMDGGSSFLAVKGFLHELIGGDV
ncbi:UDP-glucuronosyl/UDP-glucosyltransferase [Arabidopsis suecica]|uniref:Glycosyltransferase n=1 Tax=Arabidopsis suecica TaxID=45249 RepID=A0A8T2H101_ARASU|nr:UDP-glucuronosyl/UDP-glucosyltransferase [Arabidopsis suecica]